MNKNIFEDERRDYDNIEIPEELNFRVKKAIKEGKKQILKKRIYNVGKSVVALFVIFVASVNISATAEEVFSSIPGFKKLVELVKIDGGDDGFENAIKEGLVQSINYTEEKNGIEFKLNSLSGDYKKLWVNYYLSNSDQYYVECKIEEDVQYSTFQGDLDRNENYFELSLVKFIPNITMKFLVYEKSSGRVDYSSRTPIETFTVAVKLDEGFNIKDNEKEVISQEVDTPLGILSFEKVVSTKTITTLKYKWNNDKYESITLVNPRLVDDSGKEYIGASHYISNDGLGYNLIDFEGEVPFNKDIILKFEGVQGNPKDNKFKVYIEVGRVEENPFGIEIDTVNNSTINLESKLIDGFGIVNERREDGFSISYTERTEDGYCYNSIENNGEDIIEFEVYDVRFRAEREVKLEINQ